MPKLDGFGVLKLIRMDKEISETPVVVVTVKGDQRTEEKCRELGCVGFIRKPVALRQLHEHLERCVFRKSQRRRKWLRAQFNRRISVTSEGSTEMYFAPILSEGGIYVRTKDPLPNGAEVQIAVALDEGKEFLIQGRVIYHRQVFSDIFRMEPGMAIEFVGVPSDAAAALSAYLSKQLAGDLVEEQDEEVISLEDQSKAVTI
jgi:CheY-like chemotaxis protein